MEMHQLIAIPLAIVIVELLLSRKGQSSIAKLYRFDQNAKWEIASYILAITSMDFLFLKIVSLNSIQTLTNWVNTNSGALFKLQNSIISSVLIFIVFDFIVYWVHRLEHSSSWFWLAHKFHHSVQELTVLSSTRSHPLHSLFRIKLFLIYLFGFAVFKNYALVFHLFLNVFAHSRIDSSFGFIGKYLFITPRFHYKHHSLISQNCNYSNGLVLWDFVFGTYSAASESIYSIKCGLPQNEVDLNSISHTYLSPFVDFIFWPIKWVYIKSGGVRFFKTAR